MTKQIHIKLLNYNKKNCDIQKEFHSHVDLQKRQVNITDTRHSSSRILVALCSFLPIECRMFVKLLFPRSPCFSTYESHRYRYTSFFSHVSIRSLVQSSDGHEAFSIRTEYFFSESQLVVDKWLIQFASTVHEK